MKYIKKKWKGLVQKMDDLKQKLSKILQSPYVTPINTIIVVCNLILFFIIEFTDSTLNADYMLSWGAVTAELVVVQRQYYRIFMEMFLHFGIEHLLGNMLLLVLMGSVLERHIGKIRYLLVYLGSGIAAGTASVFYHWLIGERGTVCAGASGAIFGVVGGIIYLIIEHHGFLEQFDIKTMIVFLILNFYTANDSGGIDVIAHFGGLLTGLLLTFLLCRITRKEKTSS